MGIKAKEQKYTTHYDNQTNKEVWSTYCREATEIIFPSTMRTRKTRRSEKRAESKGKQCDGREAKKT